MFDKNFLNKIKNKLEEEKKELEKDLTAFTEKNVHNINDYQAKYPDFGEESDENAREVATFGDRLTLERTLEKELRDVNKALERIKKGTYGICYNCNKAISKDRLLARPTSSTCVKCKTELKGEK